MEKYIVPLSPPQNPNPKYRCQWKRKVSELNGKISHKNRHEDSQILINSYFEVRAFEHHYRIGSEHCPTYTTRLSSVVNNYTTDCIFREGVTALEFDSKGVYLASVTKSGCLTIHDFETLYCLTFGPSSSSIEDESKQLLHITASHSLDTVRWNPTNQDEVACSSKKINEVLLYDIGYASSEPAEVLHKGKSKYSRQYGEVCNGLSDIVFSSDDKSRLISSGLDGAIYVWDRRSSYLPCLELHATSYNQFNSIELDKENRVVFGASKHGVIYAWDLRGGRVSHAFQSLSEAYHPPLTCLKISSMLEKITDLKAQANIRPKEIHAINFDPSCSYQLAFHLDDGWSGVLNLNSLNVTHVHCPPPAWLESREKQGNGFIFSGLRRPAWLPSSSVYAVASSSAKGIHLLDFFPVRSSASHVDYNEASHIRNRYCSVSENVISCAAHPLNGTIIAGTQHSSLLLISHNQHPRMDFNLTS